jgi:cystathionine beta-lyase family protein involved in aluminum resistance
MSDIAKILGQRIRNCRTEQGLSQEKLAELSGCHPTYIGQVERGEKNATIESIEKIALALNVPLSKLFEKLGYNIYPVAEEERHDIIQTITLGTEEGLLGFCAGIQAGSPVDSHVTPEAWDMPGYADAVVMAAGAFTSGASIELSADGPVKAPYTAYLQGGLTYESGKIGILLAAQIISKED